MDYMKKIIRFTNLEGYMLYPTIAKEVCVCLSSDWRWNNNRYLAGSMDTMDLGF